MHSGDTRESHVGESAGGPDPRLVSTKRSLALREFALSIEALERFVLQEPLRRVHECVFGVLALESEPVDPLVCSCGNTLIISFKCFKCRCIYDLD